MNLHVHFVSGNFWVRGQEKHRTEYKEITLIRILRESDSDGSYEHHGACQTLVLTEMILRNLLSLNRVVTINPHLSGVSAAGFNEVAACS
jgi:hypothetical protein